MPFQFTVFPECKEGEFKCHNQQCIPRSKHCDGNFDCFDRTDETQCGKKLLFFIYELELRKDCHYCLPQGVSELFGTVGNNRNCKAGCDFDDYCYIIFI